MSSVKRQRKMKCEKCPLDFGITKSLTPEYAFVFLLLFCFAYFLMMDMGDKMDRLKSKRKVRM